MNKPGSTIKREYLYTKDDFAYIRDLVHKEVGIHLKDVKQDMVYSRLARRLRALQFSSFEQYCRYLNNNIEQELVHTINAMTTNLTHFFREGHHFNLLTQTIIPDLVKEQPGGKRIRIWSAGCSTGEEPYSVAISVLDALPNHSQWDIKILASDVDTDVIEKCRTGIYDRNRIDPIEDRHTMRWFKQHSSSPDQVIVDDQLKKLISFKQLNLIDHWPISGPFDVIFCRNVVIYFDKPTQQKLFKRFYELLAPGGYLFLGHSEQLGEMQKNFILLGKTSFKKS